jgi:hypothetical protein
MILGGANPNTRTTFLHNAPLLCVAAKEGFVDLVSLLLEFHARVDATGSDGVAALSYAGEFHEADAEWIVIRWLLWVIMARPAGGQPQAGLSAAMGLAVLRTYLVVLVTIN